VREKIERLRKLESELVRISTSPHPNKVGECYVIHALADHDRPEPALAQSSSCRSASASARRRACCNSTRHGAGGACKNFLKLRQSYSYSGCRFSPAPSCTSRATRYGPVSGHEFRRRHASSSGMGPGVEKS
jgi:hypothetical protein